MISEPKDHEEGCFRADKVFGTIGSVGYLVLCRSSRPSFPLYAEYALPREGTARQDPIVWWQSRKLGVARTFSARDRLTWSVSLVAAIGLLKGVPLQRGGHFLCLWKKDSLRADRAIFSSGI